MAPCERLRWDLLSVTCSQVKFHECYSPLLSFGRSFVGRLTAAAAASNVCLVFCISRTFLGFLVGPTELIKL